MKIKVSKESISSGSLVKLIATGYSLGVGALSLLPLALMGVIFLLSAFSDETRKLMPQMLIFIVMVPFIIVMQGLMMSVIINFGLWIYKLKKPIEIEFEE